MTILLAPALDQQRFRHVVKHLYNPEERWDLVDPQLADDPRRRAQERGCRVIELGRDVSWERVREACRTHVLQDHAVHLFPACEAAVVTAQTAGRYGRIETAQGFRDAFVGNNGVFVLVATRPHEPPRRLLTGYRVVPPRVADPTNDHFLAAAVRKLRDKTSLSAGARE